MELYKIVSILLETIYTTIYFIILLYKFYYSVMAFFYDLFIAFIGGSLALASAYIIFKIQSKRDLEKDIYNKFIEAKAYIVYLHGFLERILQTSEKQNEKYIEYQSNFEITPYKYIPLFFLSNDNISRLNSIDNLKLNKAYEYFFSNKNSNWFKEFQSIFESLDFINGQRNENYETHKKYMADWFSESNQVKNKIDFAVTKLANITSTIRRNNPKEFRTDEVYIFSNNWILIYYGLIQKGINQIDDLHAPFIEPLLIEILDKFPDMEEFQQVLEALKFCRVKLNEIKTMTKDYSEKYIQAITYNEGARSNLSRIKEKLAEKLSIEFSSLKT